jgi:hypothetical protein
MNPLTRRTLIVMTATITPAQGIGNSVRVDPALRLSEYLEAFRHYASLPDELVQGILFLENSGHDLTPFRELQRTLGTRKQIEFLSTSTDYPAEKGKGYGEFLMLDQGMSHLRAQGWPGDTQVWKVTGRLIVKNMARMVRQAPPAFALYADFRHVPVLGSRLGGTNGWNSGWWRSVWTAMTATSAGITGMVMSSSGPSSIACSRSSRHGPRGSTRGSGRNRNWKGSVVIPTRAIPAWSTA